MKSKKLIFSAIAIFVFLSITISTCEDKSSSEYVYSSTNSNLSDSLENSSSSSSFENSLSESGNLNETQSELISSSKNIILQTQTTNAALVYSVPKFNNKPYVTLNNNLPDFKESDLTTTSFEKYSELDEKGRCGVAIACIGQDIMPTEERGEIGQVKPSGWHTVKYDIVDGKYLYNRCHLIGYQLTGENANTRNLITGTRYLNVEGMLPFENMVADYVKETGNHVLYRVTPIFENSNLLASGVQMEGYSVEDSGEGICFNVYCYNSQPGVTINYSNGESKLVNAETISTTKQKETTTPKPSSTTKKRDEPRTTSAPAAPGTDYVVNTNTGKFHYPHCSSADDIKPINKWEFVGTRDELITDGYVPCKRCNP